MIILHFLINLDYEKVLHSNAKGMGILITFSVGLMNDSDLFRQFVLSVVF